jgi:GDP-L-fucose synthase
MSMRIYIAGINGMVGSAISQKARNRGYEVLGKSSQELDFTNKSLTFDELENERPDVLIVSAAKVGGIGANFNYPVDFLSINLQIQTNLLEAANLFDIKRVLFLGSSCIYPKFASQPIHESALLTGALEPTNEPYALAKIAGLKLVQAYRKQYLRNWISAMPTNLYGPKDNFDPESAHVLPALVKRFDAAKRNGLSSVTIWGDGSPLREFLYVEDLADACLVLIEKYDDASPVNIGSGEEISIKDLARAIARVIGFDGQIKYDTSRPNGTPRKFLDSSLMSNLGWSPSINLESGLKLTYEWFQANEMSERSQ